MNILEEFENYKKEYAKKNKLPEITDSINKYWQLAWQSFMNEVLVPNWQDIKDSYLDNTPNKPIKDETNGIAEEETVEESAWSKVKNYLK